MIDLNPHLEALAHSMSPAGGWGYAPGHGSQLEPSCLGLLALSLDSERYADAIAKTRSFIAATANPDGSYRQHDGRTEAIWPTSLVLFVKSILSPLPEGEGNLNRTADFLLATRGQVPDDPDTRDMHDMNVKLVGWPWAEANFSWVEPTSWACLALRNLGFGNHPRVAEGLKLLLDRAFDTGGVNYGNRRILGKMTDPIPGPTALMLLALQGESHPRLAAAVRYLIEQIRTEDLDHLCWAKLALDLYRDQPNVEATLAKLDDQILAAVEKRQQLGWLRQSCYRQALTVLALGVEKRNLFRLQSSASGERKLPDSPASSNQEAYAPRSPSIVERVSSWFRRFLLRATSNVKPLPANSAVHIARAASYDDDLTAILQKQYDSFRGTVPLAGKRVVLKPNLVEWHRDKVINTHPKFVGAVIELCKREGAAEVIVAEGPGHWRNVEYLVTESGLGDVLKQHDVRFVDINHDEPVKLPNMGQLTNLDYLYMSSTLANADVVISLPKLKTHHWAGATLSLKNLFGTLPGIYYGWPKNELHWRGIHNSIVDIALTRTPELAIVDGIIGMEGDGPLNGTAKPFGALIMGHDLVAVDATCCRLMMLDPDKVGYLVLGAMKKLGRLKEAEIAQLGETIASLAQPFATVPHLDELRMKKSA